MDEHIFPDKKIFDNFLSKIKGRLRNILKTIRKRVGVSPDEEEIRKSIVSDIIVFSQCRNYDNDGTVAQLENILTNDAPPVTPSEEYLRPERPTADEIAANQKNKQRLNIITRTGAQLADIGGER